MRQKGKQPTQGDALTEIAKITRRMQRNNRQRQPARAERVRAEQRDEIVAGLAEHVAADTRPIAARVPEYVLRRDRNGHVIGVGRP